MLDGGDDVAPRGQLAEVVGVVGAGGGHAVGEDHDGELFGGLEQRHVDLGGDGDAAADGPEEEGQDGAEDEVVHVGELGVALGGDSDGLRDPVVLMAGGARGVGDRVVDGEEHRLDLEGGLVGGLEGDVGDAVRLGERDFDVDGADAVRAAVAW